MIYLVARRFRRARRFVASLQRDFPGEESALWRWLINDLAGASIVPARVRKWVYRQLGVALDRRSLVLPGVYLRTRRLSLGAESTINLRCVFDNRAGVTIGDRVGVGIGVQFVNSGHEISDSSRRAGSGLSAPVVVHDGAYIGSGVILLPGVTVGMGAVIAAGAVVVRDVDPHTLVAGVPAKTLRDLTSN